MKKRAKKHNQSKPRITEPSPNTVQTPKKYTEKKKSPIFKYLVPVSKYAYILTFFVFLAGVFYPLITQTDGGPVIMGTFSLILGLFGGILIYKAVESGQRTGLLVWSGLGLIALSLLFILQIAVRIF